ncbi:NAD(+) diphosphatase [Cryobacterium arcticum]|uniref:NAD(+) diphosphatase n=1 Tax=Cryobacterium arcticum TaxID=670052 RepID=A0A1B1BHJ0_9MICO|nr:NAD(+) diphosphatase [Cryobacterium arcticum]ANP72018.1 NADH pyrophosphatase [Cryobacterium arcticum]
MSFRFTARLPLSRHAVDRDNDARARTDLFETLWADAGTRLLPLWHGKALLAEPLSTELENAAPRVLLLAPAELAAGPGASGLQVYLGRSLDPDAAEPVGTPIIAVPLDDEQAAALEPDESRWVGLRDYATLLSDRDTGIFTESLGILHWHESHPHCPRCGAATEVTTGGWVRHCPVDGSQVFPRTDAAVIVLITDDQDRVLLGSNAMWEANRYSLLAGFVEPGESFESAVVREVFEESGLRVADPVYHGSQPWPFPASIMVGFTARLADGQHSSGLVPDGTEILDLRWFSRAELSDSENGIMLPGASSIARALIDDWLVRPATVSPGV